MARRATLRASDDDREQVVDRLRHAAAEGRLLASELEERVGAAFSARTYGELDAVVADLPRDPSPRVYRARPSLIRLFVMLVCVALVFPVVTAMAIAAMVLLATVFTVSALMVVVGLCLVGRRRHLLRRYGPPLHAYGRLHGGRAPTQPGRGFWL
jgi:DUF1707 SHOCT-like domain